MCHYCTLLFPERCLEFVSKAFTRVPTNQVCKNLLQSKFLPSPSSLSPPMSHPSRELPLMGGCSWRISKSHQHGYVINKRVLVHFLSSCLTSQRTNIQRNPIEAGFMRNLRTVLSSALFEMRHFNETFCIPPPPPFFLRSIWWKVNNL